MRGLIQLPKDLTMIAARYAQLRMEPLQVRAILGSPYLSVEKNGALNLDSILSKAFFDALPWPTAPASVAVTVPLPLALLWVSPEGLPLWNCSQLYPWPEGKLLRGKQYWHKRYPSDRMMEWSKKKNANLSAGRNKEYRVPMPALVPEPQLIHKELETPVLQAHCVGNREEIAKLLDHITHVGKKPTQGQGRVLRWEITPLSESADMTRVRIMNSRPMPARYFLEEFGSAEVGDWVRRTFTPPYWYQPWAELCLEAR